MLVQQQYFDALSRGTKTIEGRIAKTKYTRLRPGDTIAFESADTHAVLIKTVTAISRFPTFASMLRHHGIRPFLPDPAIKTIEQACAVYHSFGDYKKEEEKYGVIAIHVT